MVNALLFVLNQVTSPGHYWFVWPLFGWGLGLVFHAMSVFGGLWDGSWEERKIKELMDKDARR